MIDVTHQPEFKKLHRENLNSLSDWFEETERDPEKNGFLAAYVANKALVGEFGEGWQRMMKHYDRESDWGLTRCEAGYDDGGNCQAPEVSYKNYPQALRAFLIETGYIKAADVPAQP